MTIYRITAPNGVTYETDGPPNATPEQVKAVILAAHPEAAKPPQPQPQQPTPEAQPQGTLATPALKEVEAPGLLEMFTDPKGWSRKSEEYRRYVADKMQRADLKDLQTQTGFFDRLGDLFTRGELNMRSGIKDIEAAIERDPKLRKGFQEEARRYAADAGTPIEGETKWEDVKANWFKALPYILEQGAQSLPQMLTGRLSPIGLAASTLGTAGGVARSRAQGDDRQDVSGADAAIALPVGMASAFLDQFGLSEIVGAGGKTALVRVLKAVGAESGTEGIQNFIEYLGGSIGTKRGASAAEAFDQALAGAVAGGGMAGGMRGTHEAVVGTAKKVLTAREKAVERRASEERRAAEAVDLEGQIGDEYNKAYAGFRQQGMSEQEALVAASRAVQPIAERLRAQSATAREEALNAAQEQAEAAPEAETETQGTTPPAPTQAGATVTPSPAQVTEPEAEEEPTRTPLREPTKQEIKRAALQVDADLDLFADDFVAEYGTATLTPEQRVQAATLIATDPNIAPYDAIGSVLRAAERTPITPTEPTPQAGVQTVQEAAGEPAATITPQPEPAPIAGVQPPEPAPSLPTPEPAVQTVPEPPAAPEVPPVAEVPQPEPSPAPELPAIAGKNLKERKVAAKQVVTALAEQPDYAGMVLPPKAISMATDRLARTPDADPKQVFDSVLTELKVEPAPAPAAVATPEPPAVEPTPVVEPQAAQEQEVVPEEQPVETVTETATVPVEQVMQNPAYFAKQEAEKQGLDAPMFAEGARDVMQGREPLTPEEITEKQGPEYADAYAAGMQWAQSLQPQEQAPTEPEAEPEAAQEEPAPQANDEYDDLLNEIEDLRYDEDGNPAPQISDQAYNLLTSAAERKKVPVEKIREQMEKAKDDFAASGYAGMYRRAETGGGVPAAEVEDHVANLMSNWQTKVPVRVVESLDELPPTLQEAVKADKAEGAQGFVSPDGTVYMMAHNLDALEDATATLYHEALGHMGLRALFGQRIDKVLQGIYDSNKNLREQADQWLRDNPDAYSKAAKPKLRALEEVLAEQSEAGRINASIWAKLTAVVKDFGRRIGLGTKFSDAEVRAILAMAHDQIVNGDRESVAVKGLRYMVKAYHGGHNHDKFDTNFIGSGEGGSRYGWGLYFSTMKQVSEAYRDSVAPPRFKRDENGEPTINGQPVMAWLHERNPKGRSVLNPALEELRAQYEAQGKPFGRKAAAKAGLPLYISGPLLTRAELGRIAAETGYMERGTPAFGDWRYGYLQELYDERDALDEDQQALLEAERDGEDIDPKRLDAISTAQDKVAAKIALLRELSNAPFDTEEGGKLYEVTLAPKHEQFLDWDKPLNEQSEYVQNALREMAVFDQIDALRKERDAVDAKTDEIAAELMALSQAGEDSKTSARFRELNAAYIALRHQFLDLDEKVAGLQTGQGVYKALQDMLGSKQAASQSLLLAGIRGNTYMGDFRVAGEKGARNYVVFGDSDVTIDNKYRNKGKQAEAQATEEDRADTGNRYARKPKKDRAGVRKLKETLATSHDAAEMDKSASELFFETRNAKDAIDLLAAGWNSLNAKRRRLTLKFLTYDRDLLRWVDRYSPPISRKLRTASETMRRMNGTRNRMMRSLTYNTNRWAKFNLKYKEGGKLLADLLNGSTLVQVDPRFPTLADAIANDKQMKELVQKGASKRALNDRRATIEYIYDLHQRLALRQYGQGQGQRLYDMAIKAYERAHDREFQLSIQSIRDSGVSAANQAAAIKQVTDIYNAAKKISPYAALSRNGDFWVRIGKGKNRITQSVRSETAWNVMQKKMIRDLQQAGDTRTAEEIMADPSTFSAGKDFEGLQSDYFANEPAGVLKRAFDAIDNANPADARAVKDLVFQMYVASLPVNASSKRLMHREGVRGFSADVLRGFADSQSRAINRYARLSHGRDLRNAIGNAYALLEGNPDKAKLSPFVDEMAARAGDMLAPQGGGFWNAFAAFGNKATYFYFLLNVKSMMVQMLHLPTVGLSVLGSRYGFGNATKIMARYTATMGNKFGTHKTDENGDVITEWGEPRMGDSKYVKDNKDPELRKALQYAWEEAVDRGILDTTFAGDMLSRRSEPSEQYQSRARRALSATFGFLSGGMHHTERMTREAMYMMAFELDYKKRRAEGIDADTARVMAAEAAADATLEGMFDYAESSKPRAFKHPLGRLAFQYFTFPIQMVSMLGRSFATMFRLLPTARERVVAAKQFFGVLGTVGMFGGVVGMPFYSLMMGAAEGVRDLLRDLLGDDDDDYLDDEYNPLADQSLDLWFREKFLPEYFGPDSNIAQAMDLDAEQAETLTRVVKMGPVSALTDMDFGSSMSLDGLFFHDQTTSDTNEDAIESAAFNMLGGAAGSLAKRLARGMDYWQKGEGDRAAEMLLPGVIRNILIANRLEKEGNLTTKGAEIKAREWYTTGKLMSQRLGFGSTEVADIQRTNTLARKMVKDIEGDRAKLVDQIDRTFQEMQRDPSEANLKAFYAMFDKADEFNRKTGYINPITVSNISASLETRRKARDQSFEGLQVEGNYKPFIRDLVGR